MRTPPLLYAALTFFYCSIRYCAGAGADGTVLHNEKKAEMPDVVVVTIPKKADPPEGLLPASFPLTQEALKPPPPPKSMLAKLRHLLFLPIRTVRAFLSRMLRRLRKRLFGPQPKP